MLKIRLAKQGRKKLSIYHLIVTESKSPRDSGFIEKFGNYSPMLDKTNPNRLTFVKDRVEYWLSVGAKPTDVVARLITRNLIK
jgi:small subunit ribosomal protein S16